MTKLKKIFPLALIVAGFYLFVSAPQVSAAVCDIDTQLDVVARDSGGSYIPGVKAELYYQVTDANGDPKPGTRATSATANANTGIATLKFRNSGAESATYALKIQSITKEYTSFWYYGLDLSCGQQANLEKTLSGINIVLRDYDGNLLYNTALSIYTQRYDADGNAVKQTKDLVASLNTGVSGAVSLYVPQGSVRSLDGVQSDDYVLEITRNNKKFSLYNIKVIDGQMTNVNYYSSALKVTLRTAVGALFPGKTKVEVWEQVVDSNNNNVRGDKIGEFLTLDDGYGIFENPASVYVLGVKGSNGEYDYLWDVEINDGQLNEYEWNVGTTWQAGTETCQTSSKFILNLMGINGSPLSGFRYELYEQELDTFGRPAVGKKVGAGTSSATGRAELSFKPDPRKNYALKVYEKKSDVGEFWFFDSVRFVCGADRTMNKSLPYLRIILRDGSGNLKKNYSFSLYEQTYDADNKPVKDTKRLISSLKTGEDGAATVYVAPRHPYDLNKRGLYVFSASSGKSVFDAYNIAVSADSNATFEYVFSNLSLTLRNAAGQAQAGKDVKLYTQANNNGQLALGALLTSGKTDDSGNVQLEYPAGTYAAVTKDSLGNEAIFWNINIVDRQANRSDLVLNTTKITLANAVGELLAAGTSLKVYSLYENKGGYYKDKEVGTVKLSANRLGEALLGEGPYLISYIDKAQGEFGQAFWAINGGTNNISIKMVKSQQITGGQRFALSKPASVAVGAVNADAISKRMAGNILLQVEDKGQAWYLNPKDLKRYYMSNGAAAFGIMRSAGVGATDADLAKIPIGVDSRFAGVDSDGDLLPDGLEVAIGTNPYDSDSDNDGYLDGEEVKNGFNPLGTGRLNYDLNFANKQKGRILLQVHKNGEAWYINPKDGKRYYLGNGELAFQIMRYLSVGITNKDLNTISLGQ
ncbi:MAG: thrombospondin type 3 repeat-containing protein [bacterium]|nr:thrombospondin type 3 repeat-containing protein [bacterium]